MKIGMISNLYPPFVRGGAEHVVVRTVEELIEVDQEVFVITAGPRGEYSKIKIDDRPSEKIYRFFPGNIYFQLDDYKHRLPVRFLWHIYDAFNLSSRFKVAKILKEEKPDIVMTHNMKGIGLGVPKAIQSLGIPHIHVVHDLQLIYPSGLVLAGKEHVPFFLKPIYCAYQKICKIKFGRPDIVIFPSNYLKKEYDKKGFFKKSKVVVLPNPSPSFDFEERHPKEDDTLRLLFVGQLEHHKGIKFLLDSFKKFPQKAQLIIAGEGTCTEMVKKYAENDRRITHLGYIALDQLINCFGLADALVVPSLCYENSPTVIYESFEAGVPVIASDIGGVGELVQDGKNGFLFEPGNQADFLKALKRLSDEKQNFSVEDIKKTLEQYSASIYIEKILKFATDLSDVKDEKLEIADPRDYLGKMVKTKIDRPIGSKHPEYEYKYEANYGFVPETLSPDGYELDAYVLGVDKPIEGFEGRCIAFIRRTEDNDDKLIVVPDGVEMTDEEIKTATYFQEQFFESEIIR